MSQGRIPSLKPAVQRRIVQAIHRGNTLETAAAAAGVHRTTLFSWMAKGRQENAAKLYRDFLYAVEKAQASAKMASVGVIRHAARSTWQAAAWWLERRYPDEWGRKDRVSVEHVLRQQAKVMAEQLGMDEDEILADAERILAGLN